MTVFSVNEHKPVQLAKRELCTTLAAMGISATEGKDTERSFVGEILTDTRSVRTNQIDLEFFDRLGRNDDILEVAKTGINTVLDNLVTDNIINNLSTRL